MKGQVDLQKKHTSRVGKLTVLICLYWKSKGSFMKILNKGVSKGRKGGRTYNGFTSPFRRTQSSLPAASDRTILPSSPPVATTFPVSVYEGGRGYGVSA